MNTVSKVCLVVLLVGATMLTAAPNSGRGGGRGPGKGGSRGEPPQQQREPGRDGGQEGGRTILICPHCKHRLVVFPAPEQGARGNDRGGLGKREGRGNSHGPRSGR